MGREIKRVPLDFKWPMNKVWHGYINPHGDPCPEADAGRCFGGYTAAGRWLDAVSRLIALIGDEAAANTPESIDRMRGTGRVYPHPWLREWQRAPRTEMTPSVRGALDAIECRSERIKAYYDYQTKNPPQILPLEHDLVELVRGLSKGRGPTLLSGSDVSFEISRTLILAAGVRDGWGVCVVCGGHGDDPSSRDAREAWEPEEPPAGDGWQLWETVSEGSPISPVFPTEDDFVRYLAGEGYSLGAARSFVQSGWAPTGEILDDGRVVKDIETCRA